MNRTHHRIQQKTEKSNYEMVANERKINFIPIDTWKACPNSVAIYYILMSSELTKHYLFIQYGIKWSHLIHVQSKCIHIDTNVALHRTEFKWWAEKSNYNCTRSRFLFIFVKIEFIFNVCQIKICFALNSTYLTLCWMLHNK